jgi:hypothetical protein
MSGQKREERKKRKRKVKKGNKKKKKRGVIGGKFSYRTVINQLKKKLSCGPETQVM